MQVALPGECQWWLYGVEIRFEAVTITVTSPRLIEAAVHIILCGYFKARCKFFEL